MKTTQQPEQTIPTPYEEFMKLSSSQREEEFQDMLDLIARYRAQLNREQENW